MANNAVFPLNAHGSQFREPDHLNTKHNAHQLKPEYSRTLHEGSVPTVTPYRNRNEIHRSNNQIEDRYRSLKTAEQQGQVPEFQLKKIIRKKALAPAWESDKKEQLQGLSMKVNISADHIAELQAKYRQKKLFP